MGSGLFLPAYTRVHQFTEGGLESINLDRITKLRPSSMHLDVTYSPGIDRGLAIGRNQEVGLRSRIRSGERIGTPAMIFSGGSNDCINMIASLLCIGELFEYEHTNPLATYKAIGLSREGFAPSI